MRRSGAETGQGLHHDHQDLFRDRERARNQKANTESMKLSQEIYGFQLALL